MEDVKKITPTIHKIRRMQVMLDSDLAAAYQIEVMRLNQAVKRNLNRFPSDFMFQLTKEEWENLRFQIGTSSWNNENNSLNTPKNLKSQFVISSWGGRRKLPFVFTEHGVTMLSSVLSSPRAIEINIAIVRAFVAMRHYVTSPIEKKIADLEKVLMLHIDDTNHNFDDHAKSINDIINALNMLLAVPEKPKRKIGFVQ